MPTKGPDFGHLADWAFDSGMKCVRCAMLCASPGGRICSDLRNMELPSGFLKRGSEWMISDLICYSILSARKWYKSYQILLSLDKISKVHYSNLPRHPKLFQWSSQATPQKCYCNLPTSGYRSSGSRQRRTNSAAWSGFRFVNWSNKLPLLMFHEVCFCRCWLHLSDMWTELNTWNGQFLTVEVFSNTWQKIFSVLWICLATLLNCDRLPWVGWHGWSLTWVCRWDFEEAQINVFENPELTGNLPWTHHIWWTKTTGFLHVFPWTNPVNKCSSHSMVKIDSLSVLWEGPCRWIGVFFLQHQVVWGSVVLIPDIHRSLWLLPLPGPWILTVAKIKPLIWQVTFLWFWLQASLSWSASSSDPSPTMFSIPPVSPSENLPAWGELNMVSGRVWQWDVFDRFQIFSTWRTIPRIVSG